MLIAYMSHLELCFEIFDEQVLEFISKNVTYVFDTSSFLGSFELKLQSNCAWEVTEDIKYHLVGYLKHLKIPSFLILAAFRSSF